MTDSNRIPTTLRQQPEFDTRGRPTRTVHDLTHALNELIGTLPFGAARDARRRLTPLRADAIEQVARRKISLAVEHEVALYAHRLDAERLTALVNLIKIRADLRCILANIFGNMATVLVEYQFKHDDKLDALAAERVARLEERHAAGLIDTQRLQRRLAAVQSGITQLSEGMEGEINDMIASYRHQLHEVLARACVDI